jgi:hypothetical protein
MKSVGCVFNLFLVIAVASTAEATLLDFSSPGTPNGGALPQSYGDTAQLDVQYRTRVGLGNTFIPDPNLDYSATGWIGTSDVLTVNPACGASSCTGEIFLLPAAGYQVTLNSFQLTVSSVFSMQTSQYGIFDPGFASLASSGGTFPISTLMTFSPAVTSTSGIRLQWGPTASGVAIDNIDYTVSAIPTPGVPEPSSWILLATGFGLIGLGRMHRGWRNRHKWFAAVALAVLCVIVPKVARASVIPISFYESSHAQAGIDNQRQNVTNLCAGSILICGTTPTLAQAADHSTRAMASTDGRGASQLSLQSADSRNFALAETDETGTFHAESNADIQMRSFFPGITLLGVFTDPTSYVDYRIAVVGFGGSFFTEGRLDSSGFTFTGTDVGARFDRAHHEVDVPPFFLDLDLGEAPAGSNFAVRVVKTLRFDGPGGVEFASGEIIDPFGVSSPLRNGLIFTETDTVPEPGTFLLMACGVAGLVILARVNSSLAGRRGSGADCQPKSCAACRL